MLSFKITQDLKANCTIGRMLGLKLAIAFSLKNKIL
jgi:hypothetical protein